MKAVRNGTDGSGTCGLYAYGLNANSKFPELSIDPRREIYVRRSQTLIEWGSIVGGFYSLLKPIFNAIVNYFEPKFFDY